MTHLVFRTELDASPMEAFDFLTDLEFMPTWNDQISQVTLVDAPDPRVGSIVREVRRLPRLLGGRGTTSAVLTTLQPGRRIAGIARARSINVQFAYEFRVARGGRTIVTLRCAVSPTSALTQPIAWLARSIITRQETHELQEMAAGLSQWRRAGRSAA